MTSDSPPYASTADAMGTTPRVSGPPANPGAAGTWSRTPIRQRLAALRRLRHAIADHIDEFVTALAEVPGRKAAESVAAEVLPLADAIRFLERRATRALAPDRPSLRLRPAWLFGTDVTVHREPLGRVLIIAPSNYPLFLPGVQIAQALAAGNDVLVKPAPGCAEPMRLLRSMAIAAGIEPGTMELLDTDVRAVEAAIPQVNHVVFTGSSGAGRAVLARASGHLVPVTLELSGYDAFFILPGADMELATRALAFGMTFSGGRTCIAPHRVFVPRGLLPDLEERLRAMAFSLPPVREDDTERLTALAADALGRGAIAIDSVRPPRLLSRVPAGARVMADETFGPVAAVCPVGSMNEALEIAARCPYALGATIIGPDADAATFAARVNAGCVVINDCVAPTADPRVPFPARGHSGFGVTRGLDGLLALTRPKVVIRRRGTFRPHYDPPSASDAATFSAYVRAAHARSLPARLWAVVDSVKRLAARRRSTG